MLSFKQFIKESHQSNPLEKYPVLSNFLHHLSSPTFDHSTSKEELDEAARKPSLKAELKLRKSDLAAGYKALKRIKHTFTGESPPESPHPVERIHAEGLKNQPQGKLRVNLKAGFHAAFPEGESEKETRKKAMEARSHFRAFMAERGGHSRENSINFTGDNGKTKLSSGEGMQSIGLSLTPHHSSGYNEDLCPHASTECKTNCLGFTAGGNKQYPETAFRGKLLRTQYLAEHPERAARLMSHEISENEKWVDAHHSIHDKEGNLVGYRNKKSGKITSEIPTKSKSKEEIAKEHENNKKLLEAGIASGTHSLRNIKSGFRGNMTSDLEWEKLMPKKYFERHKNTQFYDYTKNAARVMASHKLPANYALALSHTGADHDESNDEAVVKALNAGKVVAMVHHRIPAGESAPTHVEDVQSGKRWKIVNGDDDDNVFDRHRMAGVDKSEGVVSGLELKGVKNEAAGKFANPIVTDKDGNRIIQINQPREKKSRKRFTLKQEN